MKGKLRFLAILKDCFKIVDVNPLESTKFDILDTLFPIWFNALL